MIFDGEPFDHNDMIGPHYDKDKRRWFVYVHKNGKKHRINYARYIWAKHNGVWPSAGQEVDHKDGDKRNDNIENLQLLPSGANKRKYVLHEAVGEYVRLRCPACESVFVRLQATTHLNPFNERTWTACSIECAHAVRKLHGSIFRGEFEGNVIDVFVAAYDKLTGKFTEPK